MWASVDGSHRSQKKELGYGPDSVFPLTNSNKIALLPGSRKQEIAKKLPIMLELAKLFPEQEFVVAEAPGQDSEFYEPFLKPYQNVASVKTTPINYYWNQKLP